MATLAELEFEDLPDTLLTKLSDTVKGIFSRKQTDDDARFGDVHEAVTAIAERVQTGGESAEVRFSAIETELADVKKRWLNRPTPPRSNSALSKPRWSTPKTKRSRAAS